MSVPGGIPRAIVLVEGASDREALLTLAALTGRDLPREGVSIMSMGGVTNTRAFALRYGPRGCGLPLTGLYDTPAEQHVRRGLAAAGIATPLVGGDLTELGFFCCTADLEDELIRALGEDAVVSVIENAGEGRSLRLLAGMPAQRDWPRVSVLRRFLGSQSGRKARYARLLVEAIGPERAPAPLANVLASISR